MEQKFAYAEKASPTRCQGVDKAGQCPFESVPDKSYCPRHMGRFANDEKAKLRNYRSTIYSARINEKADNEAAKCLREDIGILRILLEEQLDMCTTPQMLAIHSGRISDLIIKIKQVVESCHRLEERTNALIGKDVIMNITNNFVTIIGKYVPPETLPMITQELQESFLASTEIGVPVEADSGPK